jgi:hypothetical protein
MQGISMVVLKRVQVGVGRGICSIAASNPKEESNATYSDQGSTAIMSDFGHNWNRASESPMHKNPAIG